MHAAAPRELLVEFFIHGLGLETMAFWGGKCLLCGKLWDQVCIQHSAEALEEMVRHVQTTHRTSNHLMARTSFAWSLEEPQAGHIRGALWTQPRPVS